MILLSTVLLLANTLVVPVRTELVDVFDYQKQSIENLLTKGKSAYSKGKPRFKNNFKLLFIYVSNQCTIYFNYNNVFYNYYNNECGNDNNYV